MARLYPVCSSSSGNCTFIGTAGGGVLVDVGCSFRVLKSALSYIDTELSGIEAVFVTHEHSDHIAGLAQIIKHTNIPIFASAGTIAALLSSGRLPDNARFYDINSEGYESARFKVSAFKTSHDAAESMGYIINYTGRTFGVCTDTGIVTEQARAALRGVETVLLESNYEPELLRKNPKYPADLKRRILGDRGHLSNNACAEFAEELVKNGTRHLVLGHLSRENNTPRTAYARTCEYLHGHGLETERDYTLDIAPVNTQGHYIAV